VAQQVEKHRKVLLRRSDWRSAKGLPGCELISCSLRRAPMFLGGHERKSAAQCSDPASASVGAGASASERARISFPLPSPRRQAVHEGVWGEHQRFPGRSSHWHQARCRT